MTDKRRTTGWSLATIALLLLGWQQWQLLRQDSAQQALLVRLADLEQQVRHLKQTKPQADAGTAAQGDMPLPENASRSIAPSPSSAVADTAPRAHPSAASSTLPSGASNGSLAAGTGITSDTLSAASQLLDRLTRDLADEGHLTSLEACEADRCQLRITGPVGEEASAMLTHLQPYLLQLPANCGYSLEPNNDQGLAEVSISLACPLTENF